MVDEDHWKKQYQHLWEQTGERENFIIKLIEKLTGKHVKKIGMGTGSSDFISGSAKRHGYEKGEADLIVEGTNVKIEVTGPTIDVPVTSDLWIRPDKIDNAMAHFPEFDTWVVHCILNKVIRVVHLDEEFFKRYKRGQYDIVRPRIRTQVEKYIAVPANDSNVHPFEVVIEYLNHYR